MWCGEGKPRISADPLLLSLGKMPERGTDTSDADLSPRCAGLSQWCLACSPAIVAAWRGHCPYIVFGSRVAELGRDRMQVDEHVGYIESAKLLRYKIYTISSSTGAMSDMYELGVVSSVSKRRVCGRSNLSDSESKRPTRESNVCYISAGLSGERGIVGGSRGLASGLGVGSHHNQRSGCAAGRSLFSQDLILRARGRTTT